MRIYKGYNGVTIRQLFGVIADEGLARRREVLLGLKGTRLRLRYPQGTVGRVYYLDSASTDLKTLAALAIAELLDLSIFADKLQEEFPEHEEAAIILREWQSGRN